MTHVPTTHVTVFKCSSLFMSDSVYYSYSFLLFIATNTILNNFIKIALQNGRLCRAYNFILSITTAMGKNKNRRKRWGNRTLGKRHNSQQQDYTPCPN